MRQAEAVRNNGDVGFSTVVSSHVKCEWLRTYFVLPSGSIASRVLMVLEAAGHPSLWNLYTRFYIIYGVSIPVQSTMPCTVRDALVNLSVEAIGYFRSIVLPRKPFRNICFSWTHLSGCLESTQIPQKTPWLF